MRTLAVPLSFILPVCFSRLFHPPHLRTVQRQIRGRLLNINYIYIFASFFSVSNGSCLYEISTLLMRRILSCFSVLVNATQQKFTVSDLRINRSMWVHIKTSIQYFNITAIRQTVQVKPTIPLLLLLLLLFLKETMPYNSEFIQFINWL